jgi:hypothetical protein
MCVPRLHKASCHSYSQHRGSLHAHILLWVDKEDAKRVEREITATRCKYKLATALDGCPYVPDIPEWSADGQPSVAEQLYLLVSNKQVHNCRTGPFGCKSKGGDAQAAAEADAKCRYGFPYQPNTGEIFLCNATNRHVPLATALLACTAAGARWTEHDLVWASADSRGASHPPGTCTHASASTTRMWCRSTRQCCWRGVRT